MRGFSLWQPWATLMRLDAKRFETRSWATAYRGTIAIHASKNRDELELCLEEPFRSVLVAGGINKIGDLPFGAFVALAELIAIYKTGVDGRAVPVAIKLNGAANEPAFGNYAPDRFAWYTKRLRPLREPLPARGYQGLWTIPAEQEKELLALASPLPAPPSSVSGSQRQEQD